jgi:hypothetical protein
MGGAQVAQFSIFNSRVKHPITLHSSLSAVKLGMHWYRLGTHRVRWHPPAKVHMDFRHYIREKRGNNVNIQKVMVLTAKKIEIK